MASQADTSAQVDPQLVGNSFVEQYYKALHQYPEHLHRFYQDSSFFSRPGPDGVVILVTTMKGINEQILSFEYQNYQTEILSVDAQASYFGGVLVLVTGFLTGKDSGKRKFSQSFFLAPQENGFYVLNDVFRFVVDDISAGMPMNLPHLQLDDQTAPIAPPVPDPEPVPASQSMPNHTTTASVSAPAPASAPAVTATAKTKTKTPSPEATPTMNDKEVDENLLPNHVAEKQSTQNHITRSSPEPVTNNAKPEISNRDQLQKENNLNTPEKQTAVVADHHHHHPVVSNQNGTHTVPAETSTPRTPDSKKSFASIVNALKDNSAPFQVRVPPPSFRKPSSTVTAAFDPIGNDALKKNIDNPAAAKTFTIFVANLPMDVTAEQVKEMFIKFGPIKPNGVRIRNNQLRPNCFSFIEYDSPISMENALKASPITFGDRRVYVEEKKGGNDPVNVRRNPAGPQNDNLRSPVNSNGRINPQAAVSAATGGPRYYQNDAVRIQKVNQNDGSRVGRQGQVDKKNTSFAMSSKAAGRTGRK